MRAIADVAVAVTQGDLTRSITVETQGEVAALKDTINEMIRNLKDTTQKNTEQDWLKTNLAKFSRMLQGEEPRGGRADDLGELAPVVGAQQAEFYVLSSEDPKRLVASCLRGRARTASGLGGAWSASARSRRKLTLSGVPVAAFKIVTGLSERAVAGCWCCP